MNKQMLATYEFETNNKCIPQYDIDTARYIYPEEYVEWLENKIINSAPDVIVDKLHNKYYDLTKCLYNNLDKPFTVEATK